MVDFLRIVTRKTQNKKVLEIKPIFPIRKCKDLMIRGGDFYAVWVEERHLWSTEEQDAIDIIDRELKRFYDKYCEDNKVKLEELELDIVVKYMWDSSSGSIDQWHKYCKLQMRDNFVPLDEKLIFSNMNTTREDYASKKLPYALEDGTTDAWDRLLSVLYSPPEKHKIEWSIGAVVNGASKELQKFCVLYGSAGTGKSTVLNIIQKLFDGYYATFDSEALTSAGNQFPLEAFRTNPLVAIQHDGDLSHIERNTRLNSLVSHEWMNINIKNLSTYDTKMHSFLYIGTNKPVKITDGRSGLIRRLIDISPTGKTLPYTEYDALMHQIQFELGAIAWKCRLIFEENPGYYNNYKPGEMMEATNDFYNFIDENYMTFKKDDGVTLKQAWAMYKEYCTEAGVQYPMSMRVVKQELKAYFDEYYDRFHGTDTSYRKYYRGFKSHIFNIIDDPIQPEEEIDIPIKIELKEQRSLFDLEMTTCPAQYANDKGTPEKKWDNVKTTLHDIDTSRLHYVRVPENHIVIDFDLKDENGEKDLQRNLEAASKWPSTYTEVSKSGKGVHLHYIYSGDTTKLSNVYDENIEIKVFNGNSSLRRQLTLCNDIPIAHLNSGLPMKGEKKVVNFDGIKSERGLRSMIQRNLMKEFHGKTKPSVDFIYKIIEDCYNSGLEYDISDLRNDVLAFAANSTNQSAYCVKLVNKMHFKSAGYLEPVEDPEERDDRPIVFYDVEVFPNVLIICWKFIDNSTVYSAVNPERELIGKLMGYRLIGFNNRRYDNHIIYAWYIGYDNAQVYELSQKIVNGYSDVMFGNAYGISESDVFDFCTKKQGLKKWEIELDETHIENEYPWDQPLPEDKWDEVVEYCKNDVIATQKVFEHNHADWKGRNILATLSQEFSGKGNANSTTNTLTTNIITGGKPLHLVYTDFRTGQRYHANEPFEMPVISWEEYQRVKDDWMGQTVTYDPDEPINQFPGYFLVMGEDMKLHNMYRGVDVGFGGYVYANPGLYLGYSKTFDVAGMHPASLRALRYFDERTDIFGDIVDTRLLIKHGELETAGDLLNGKLAPYLDDPSEAKDLSKALKLAVNSVYGLTSAKFDNPFHDIRNVNNIVALRGALFMKTLVDEVEAKGYHVIHVKTDSIKIFEPDDEIEQFIIDFGRKYSYEFEVEHTWDKICLVNNAVYIGKHGMDDPNGRGEWEAVGAQFQEPYVFKTLFSKEPLIFKDYCVVKSVKSSMYLGYDDGTYKFVGRVGQFCPVIEGVGGGYLYRLDDKSETPKYDAVTGTKGYLWMESAYVKDHPEWIDKSYFNELVDKAIDAIKVFGNPDELLD